MTPDDHPEIRISPAFAGAGVTVRLGCLTARVAVREDDPATKAALADHALRLATELSGTTVGDLPGVAEVRRAFRALGKDPSRYRPSSEALLRRVAQGKGLFNVNNLVDTNNLVSLTTRFPAGAYDLARIEGALEAGLELRPGAAGDSYEAIARGPFNLANLPALCDALGPFGSPTSDSVRTMVTADCREVLLVLYAFGPAAGLERALDKAEDALRRYCDGEVTARWRAEA
ncbi:MAG TPA: phenylalanine--tRNA ligase beta subunit-related protein [Kiloniellales bacterium]